MIITTTENIPEARVEGARQNANRSVVLFGDRISLGRPGRRLIRIVPRDPADFTAGMRRVIEDLGNGDF